MANTNPAGIQVVTRILADPVRMYLPSSYWNKARDWFIYPMDFNTLNASGNTVGTFNVQNDSDFLCLSLYAAAATLTGGLVELTYWPFLISINDSSSGANWFGTDNLNQGVASFTHLQNVAGRLSWGTSAAGGVSGVLEHPRFIPRAATVTVTINNLSANANRLWLAFRGLKLYDALRQGA